MRTVITYGTFDLLHYGHIEILRRANELAAGGRLIVGVSTDRFNAEKGKVAHMPYAKRAELVAAINYVDDVVPEDTWAQKREDIRRYGVDLFVMGNDWRGRFDELGDLCEVLYLERTEGISSTAIRGVLDDLRRMELETA